MARTRRLKRARSPIRRALRRIALVAVATTLIALGLSALFVVVLRWVPPPTTAFILQHQLAVRRAGQPERAARYRWTEWSEMTPELAVAVVAAEDQRFPDHHGLDFEAIGDALDERRTSGRLRGASTISQQVAKNLFLWPGRSLVRKGIEGYLTVLIELVWSKRRILEVYLNVAEFGDGVYGVGVASEQFFGRPPSRLDRSQAALLAAVLPSPKRFNPREPSAYVRERRDWILAQMDQLGGAGFLKGL
ncbi:MAG: monofunctional biosynthetic peptidoglycan transglycosylase [Acidobacteria bacterium]|jgi:monofunctional biosynthetic peptidoglycan transglycosylase|nr:monofunctional biosynthetic peptidoglycan transglycosylase [Acidobacteriota bacterium]MDP7340274.1 monofunctional biosynthetic peptidoglycan transglycosylase [Vicinamibacterales bacterium]MDP7478950.1 monofunctional biosynthetic peptidoglycan transglycosylase [Vicinamibacterales bacterium]MDP7691739.1 monofunctional biosynthetic peptidoglycan transglycosylase [Vicinamibacterales bacterium]HJN42743.1 monofunctional biosynthetic peptidoglycan transglycosylase [Vicinamibacterales bacterium]|tara:strand:+ start:374 stop:1117 length:744 start_codon:yes stop_codon:yes gene_type:complete